MTSAHVLSNRSPPAALMSVSPPCRWKVECRHQLGDCPWDLTAGWQPRGSFGAAFWCNSPRAGARSGASCHVPIHLHFLEGKLLIQILGDHCNVLFLRICRHLTAPTSFSTPHVNSPVNRSVFFIQPHPRPVSSLIAHSLQKHRTLPGQEKGAPEGQRQGRGEWPLVPPRVRPRRLRCELIHERTPLARSHRLKTGLALVSLLPAKSCVMFILKCTLSTVLPCK